MESKERRYWLADSDAAAVAMQDRRRHQDLANQLRDSEFTYVDVSLEEQQEILASLPPTDSEVMVASLVYFPFELYLRIQREANNAGMSVEAFISNKVQGEPDAS